ncbi:phosphonate metabolism transcriptional regulator PhnF [Albimonas pacifica]|uniref:GntR family transcriptional regulator, phosphonate transport system regulatory protein n=1 Tax=Albimonas pacifica TaxID=1114924 RepID=A0A1I3GAG5_9RHOB|nr:phosphonate metabolism transcriptional regulator PhnF [Albimonas pacifica]SFI20449.1 GntR family transcriptional regulator, phosphonate transport system regulatory protein [Albimonas pacifica]
MPQGLGGRAQAGEGAEAPAGPIWARIRDALAEEIREGRWATGERLPSETALAARFGVNRHTLRRATAALAEAGLVHVRRGAGATVTHATTDYPISRRTRFSENLRAAGREPTRRILSLETQAASRAEAEALEIARGAPVHVYEGLTLADGVPMAVARTVFPAAALPGLPEALRETGSITAALAAGGVADYTRRWTRMTACRPGVLIARHLMIPETTPLLRAESLSEDAAGRPVEYGLTWFCTDRTPLLIAEPGAAPEQRSA